MCYKPLKKTQALSSQSIAVFGSSFDPLHLGHIHVLTQVQKVFNFRKIKVIPANVSPLAVLPPLAPALQRWQIVRQVLKKYPFIEVDDGEIKKGGISYTVETLKTILKKNKDIFLILGWDQFLQLTKWKDFETIITKAHLIVCSRKKLLWKPLAFPKALQAFIKTFKKQEVVLTTGKCIYPFYFDDKDISSSYIRKQVLEKKSFSRLVPKEVKDWIKKNQLYSDYIFSSQLALFAAITLLGSQAQKIKLFDLQKLSFSFDFTLVVSAQNKRHLIVLSEDLKNKIHKAFYLKPFFVDQSPEWVALDYGNFMVHIFYDFLRDYYKIEQLFEKASSSTFY